ncbi:MAG: exodeoxyribonuclease VII large subunit [Patescibacteria group bacterium]
MGKGDLLAQLKKKRAEIAAREGVELYRVFQNDTLERTIEAAPKTKEDLADIKGWGPKKIEKYGGEVLLMLQAAALGAGNVNVSHDREIIPLSSATRGDVWSVAEFHWMLNDTLRGMGTVRVRGEISRPQVREYAFFDLKDATGADFIANCYMGRFQLPSYSHLLEDGLEVIIEGTVSLYKSGAFRIVVSRVEPVGEGALRRAFEALKKKLADKGYFDPARKRPLPAYIKNIGLITSETGDAIHDFRRNLGEYGFKIHFFDSRVEGDYAEDSLVSAVRWINVHRPDLDVLVLIRGGGSLESFKAYNSERLAEAIAASRIPVVTGIGHERDESIADFAADRRFSTPTAVAAFFREAREALLDGLMRSSERLALAYGGLLEDASVSATSLTDELFQSGVGLFENWKARLGTAASGLQHGLGKIFSGFREIEIRLLQKLGARTMALQGLRHKTELIFGRCAAIMEQRMKSLLSRVDVASAALLPLNPEAILERGYSIVSSESGRIVKDASDLSVGDRLRIRLQKGGALSRVEEIQK